MSACHSHRSHIQTLSISAAAALLAVTAAAAAWYTQRALERKKKSRNEKDTTGSDDPEANLVSPRGKAALLPTLSYFARHLHCATDPCDPTQNGINNKNPKGGFITLCVAENKLVLDAMVERCRNTETAVAAFSNSEVYCYRDFLGIPAVREAVAYFLASRFLHPTQKIDKETALQYISPSNVAIGSGCAALLHYLFYLLGQVGDCCLIPAPYYAAFEADMNLIAGIVPIPVHQAHPELGPTDEELQLAFQNAQARGLCPKFLLLTNPNNPLGTIYPGTAMKRMVQWARQRNMHTVVDEIYALSTRSSGNKKGAFESIIQTLDNRLGNDVHLLWALSKDFGSSGLRVGVIYSQNQPFMRALSTCNFFSGVSGPIQVMTAELLTDDAFAVPFLENARTRLQHSYDICTQKLDELNIPYVPAQAGLFVYVDFSSLLPEPSFQGEAQFSDVLFQYAQLVFTPGASQRDIRPGMFRICYAWVSADVLKIAMERLGRLVSKLRTSKWSDFDDRTREYVLGC